jgi:N-acetylmuramoyl-L-alanine amidase
MIRIHKLIIPLLTMFILISLTSCTVEQEAFKPVISHTDLGELPTPTLAVAATPSPSAAPEQAVTVTPLPSPIPTPTTTPTQMAYPDNPVTASNGRLIAIDAGHQRKGNNEKEPIGPGADISKPKVSTGTSGIATGVSEYQLNLDIALKVKEELINRGYEVFMIRETNDVNLSNRERAEMANESGADLFLRIHADGSENTSVNGTSTLYPSRDNPYVNYLFEDSYALSKAIVDAMCESTGAKNRGAIARDDMSGINWCTIPVCIIEMGYMSNEKEDKLMQTEEYQNKLVQGICNGIDDYYD